MFDNASTPAGPVRVRRMAREMSSDPAVPSPSDYEQTVAAVRRDSEVAHVLLGLSSALAETRSWEDTLAVAVRVVPQLLGGDRCFAVTLDRSRERMFVHAHHGFDARRSRILRDYAEDPRGLPVTRTALEERYPIFASETPSDEQIPSHEAHERAIGAVASIPLIHRGRELGGITVEYDRPRTFTSKDRSLAEGISQQLAVALANARQFSLLQSLRNSGLRIGQRLRMSGVVEAIAEGAMELLGGDGAELYLRDSATHQMFCAATHGEAPSNASLLVDLSSDPWSGLLEGKTVLLSAIGERVVDDPDLPVAVVAAPIAVPTAPLLGAVAVIWHRSIALSAEEKEALNVLAAHSAMAITNAHRFERQRALSRSLQEGLLTTDMPAVPGCRIGAVYEPAGGESDVGGDFYDVFELDDGIFGLVVGDVSGKGAEAAALTAQAKYVLRAFASRNRSPSSVLFHLNKALAKGFAEDRFATLIYAVFDSKARTIEVARGGHPPPLVFRRRTGEVEVIDPPGTILGAFEDHQFDHVSINIHPGDALIAYTDGLIEARNGDDFYGMDRVTRAVARLAPTRDAPELANALFQEAHRFGDVADDTVVFVAICEPTRS
jgi:serine phosphatase RsbU (regulator of sigma subunit)